jgi:hypothetical protein
MTLGGAASTASTTPNDANAMLHRSAVLTWNTSSSRDYIVRKEAGQRVEQACYSLYSIKYTVTPVTLT